MVKEPIVSTIQGRKSTHTKKRVIFQLIPTTWKLIGNNYFQSVQTLNNTIR